MSIPQIDPQVEKDAEGALGTIIKSPKARGYVAATTAVIGLVLGGLHQWFNGHDPEWLSQSLLVYSTIVAPAALGIWKANVR